MSDIEVYDKLIDIPVIPLRGIVIFPKMVLHFDVGRKKSILALREAMKTDQKVFLVAQQNPLVDEPNIDSMYEIGVVCTIRQMVRIPNSDNLRVIVEGEFRASLISLVQMKPYLIGTVSAIESAKSTNSAEETAYVRAVRKEFETYSSLVSKISNDIKVKVISIKDNSELCDYICYNSLFDYSEKQAVLEANDCTEKLKMLLEALKKENTTLEMESKIHELVQQNVDKNQREYYLREEMKVITDMLGETDNPVEEADEYREKINKLKCSDEIKTKLLKECDKFMKIPTGSHEGTVMRNYIEKCLDIPFGKYTKDSINLEKSRKVLDRDHYSLDKVKDRIIESLAVLKRNSDYKGQIICLVGPPGVGKTSIVKSLAKSMNRKYVRIALGGMHDEAEIRGHRRTYIGAMPGRIIESVIKSGVMNPIILLDEIDKVGSDYKGDPVSALLEVLDPEQNFSFNDNYIDFPVDLSNVFFITTANDASAIPAPLYDRMDIIELGSYTFDEKFNIAKRHLVKKEMKKHNLTAKEFKISADAIKVIIDSYTREAGVRKLEKNIAALCRKASLELENGASCVKITSDNIETYLGPKKYEKDLSLTTDKIGVVNGLAWTSVGGTMLPIEVSVLDGTGKIELTGNLGDVMKESAKIAVSYVRSIASEYRIDTNFYKEKDIHIHAPEGAVPKDGPSAGLAITTALVSELTQIPVKHTVAMTGEISLKGNALTIGGLKEKSMAAYKAGCETVIIPKGNLKDLAEISDEVKSGVEFVSVTEFEQVMEIALLHMPEKAEKEKVSPIVKSKDSRPIITQ